MNLPRPDRHARALVLFLAALTLVRGWFAAATELSPDEAYYWVWSTRLDLGYFDHGPLVAWLIRLGTTLFGPTELGVRSGALACSLVTAAGLFAITRRLSDAGRQALWVAVLASLTPLFSAGAVVHTPDAGLAAAWTLALWLGLRAFRSERMVTFVAAGAAMGLAVLAKMSGLFLLAGWFVFLLGCKHGRQRLRGAGPIAMFLTAAVVSLPLLLWNLRHAGGSFAFQLAHGTADPRFAPLGLLEFVGGQAGVASPLLWVGLLAAMAVGWRRQVRFGRPDMFFLWSFSAPLFVGFLLLSLVHKVEANWPAVCYLAALPALAWTWRGGAWYLKRVRAWTAAAAATAAVCTLLVHLQVLVPFLPIDPARDPTAKLRGWERLAQEVVGESEKLDAVPASEGYAPVSAMRFYTGREVLYEPGTTRRSQYDLWAGRAEAGERLPPRVLFLQPVTTSGVPGLCRHYEERWQLLKQGEDAAGFRIDDYRWWICEGVRHAE